MKVLFIAPYYNNSHFIRVQIKSFTKYLKGCEWKLLVLDDSKPDTLNILTNKLENIEEECKKYPQQVIYHKYPLHHPIDKGVERHRDVLTYLFKTITPLYKDEYDYLASFDADMCFIKEFDVEKELTGYDIIGPKRIQSLGMIQLDPKAPLFTYFFVHCCFFNMKLDLHTMSMDGIPNTSTDTGAMMVQFMRKHPNMKLKFYEFSSGCEGIPAMNGFEFFNRNTFFHFKCGSRWAASHRPYSYQEDIDKFNEYLDNGLTLEDEEKIEEERIRKYYSKYIRFFEGKFATEEDFRRFSL